MKRKRQAVPEVLRRAYGTPVRTLADTILSLLPQPPPPAAECRCKGRGCVGCGRRPFLLRDDDAADYRQLLTQGFAVIRDDAPPISAFSPDQRWPHSSIVRNTMEMIMAESSKPPNVICSGYNKQLRCGPIADLLTTTAWNLLLTRIGDSLMVHLLKYASIFLPLPSKNHLQVTGHAINESLQRSKILKYKASGLQSGAENLHPSSNANHVQYGQQKKRQIITHADEKLELDAAVSVRQLSKPLSSDKLTDSGISDVGGNRKKRARQFSWQRCKKRRLMDLLEVGVLNGCVTTKENSSGKLEQRSNTDLIHSGKCKQFITNDVVMETCVLEGCQLCPPECRSLRNDEIVVGESLQRELPVEMYQEVLFPSSRVAVNSEFIQVSTETNGLKRHVSKKSISSGIVIDSDLIQVNAETNELKQVAFNKFLSLEETSMNPAKVSSCDTKHSCSTADIQRKALASQEIEKQHPLLVPSKKCFYCSMLQAPRKVARRAQVKRQCMFYIFGQSRTIFPRNHILNKLKPNNFGAITLLRHIFGLPGENKSPDSFSCFHNNNVCPIKSECLYHSLINSLKTLIRKARHCQYLKLLTRHCPISALQSCTNLKDGSTSQVHERQAKLFRVLTLRKRHAGLKSLGDLSFGKSYAHVNVPQERLPLKTSKLRHSQLGLSKSYCEHKQVVSFIWAACRSIIPLDLLSSQSNWRALRRNISKFVHLRRYEKFPLNQCMLKLKTSSFPLLSKLKLSSSCVFNCSMKDEHGNGENIFEGNKKLSEAKTLLRNKVFDSWMFWFFSSIVIPMIQANFYVTESETGKQDIFYYRMPVWKKLMNVSISFLKEQNYRPLDPTSSTNIISNRSFGFSKVRFLPKENGVRPIVNLKAPSKTWLPVRECCSKSWSLGVDKNARAALRPKIPSKAWNPLHLRSVNSVLRDLYVILNRIKAEHPSELGSSVFDYNDIYKKLCPFLSGLKNESMIMPRVYIVICDVSKAFDSIDQDKLLCVMRSVMHNNEYRVQKYTRVSCVKKCLRVHYDQVSINQSNVADVTNYAVSVSSRSSNCVFVDQVRNKQIKREKLLCLLHEHVKRNLLQLGQYLYLQEVGIPQGSILSSLLCSFYYGHLEREVIFPLLENFREPSTLGNGNCGEQDVGGCLHIHEDYVTRTADKFGENEKPSVPRHILLRLIDDFLFISTSKEQARGFLSRFQRGFRDYNCWMNDGKFRMNFSVECGSGILPNMLYTGEDGISFLPWSGLLLNCCTLEIQVDYTRYWHRHMSSTLTVSRQAYPSLCLKAKLCDYMRPKCHPIFYDSNINSPVIVRLNAYQAFLLCAMKFHCYVCTLPKADVLSPNFYLQIIQKSFSYMYKLIKKRVCGMNSSSSCCPILRLRKVEVKWLGLSAYIRVLRKKQSRYVELLSLLRSEVGAYYPAAINSDLKYAIADSHSSMFWKIKY